jgi:PAS domain S-box-containing protein
MRGRSSNDDGRNVRAEVKARLRDPRVVDSSSAGVLHELQVQQVELEMQNEELRRTTQALEEARDLYGELFHFAPVGYLILSTDETIQDSNLTGAALLGADRKSLVGVPFSRFLHRADADRWHQLRPNLSGLGEWLSFRMDLRRSDGSTIHARLACEGRAAPDGKPFVRIVVTDIGEQVRAETALRESRERLAAVLDEFQDGYWEWAADGKTVVSGKLALMLGVSELADGAELSFDRAWAEQVHPDDMALARATMEDLLSGRKDQFQVSVRWKVSPDVEKWVRVRGRVAGRDAAGRALRIRGTVTDIGDYMDLRASLHRVEERAAMQAGMIRSLPRGAIGLFDHELRYVLVDGSGEVENKQSLVNLLILESYPQAEQGRISAAFRAALAGSTTELETVMGGRAVEVRAGPVMDAERRVVMGVATFQILTGPGSTGRPEMTRPGVAPSEGEAACNHRLRPPPRPARGARRRPT